MPLNKKGKKIMANMVKQYGPEKAKQVFYASRNSGRIQKVDKGFYGHIDVDEIEPEEIYGGINGCENHELEDDEKEED